ncbi:unnamed protein product [Ceutorhynchus assimilis]|uniref:Integrator complex subunit 10 n=1 Tax=Ceutorhynchus assimilis TaxID=467358 RepID=A0A9N9QS36_9CUCU|nr:unnamed protein product [Ceutorhynchus assimilis]
MEIDLEQSDEDYVIQKAKEALKIDPYTAKAWMLTAKSLYPNNFVVQFEAYLIEKTAGNVKEAAKCFSDLIGKFEQVELWKEIEKVTAALRSEIDSEDPERQFLCEMFKHISPKVQHKLLLFTANHCEDTMEHCRLLLLLLQRFPTAISSHGTPLVDTLMSAEKHNLDGHYPINSYRKLLVCELLPLLAKQEIKLELGHRLLLKLLNKALEYYFCCLGKSSTNLQDKDSNNINTWAKLFSVLEFIGKQLNWEQQLTNFTLNWSKESYWQKILSYCQVKPKNLLYEDKQLLYCLSIFSLYCLQEYNASLVPEHPPGQPATSYLLVEGFLDPSLPSPISEPKTKKRKSDGGDSAHPINAHVSVERPDLKIMQSNFLMCVNCWELLYSSENLHREFLKIYSYLKLDTWLSLFIIDYAVYRARYDEALVCLQKLDEPKFVLQKFTRMASILYFMKNYRACLEPILLSLPLLPLNNSGNLSTHLIVGGTQRHLHYLPVTRMTILQYLTKILLRCVKENMIKHDYSELSIGHIFVLAQLDWPQEEDFIPQLLEEIKKHKSFQYHLFQNYIVNVDIMEELTYLWTPQGGQINLEILPNLGSQRRIGTRGADKGAKEELKQAIKRQVARSNEKLDDLIINFLQNERALILQALV